jgi:hypothetical protein
MFFISSTVLQFAICFVLVLHSHFEPCFSSIQIRHEDGGRNQLLEVCRLSGEVIGAWWPEISYQNCLIEDKMEVVDEVVSA